MVQSEFPYLPHTEHERQEMLKDIGVASFEELVAHIPKSLQISKLELQPGKNELELSKYISSLAAKNKPSCDQISFLGGGSYRRFVPAVVPAIVSRSEFATAYTPYQPEVSQGTLQAIYEFQTAICMLTGMEVANASMYDGPTACAEAMLMACRLSQKNKVIFASSINTEYLMVSATYAHSCQIQMTTIDTPNGVLEPQKLNIDNQTSALVIQYPNYFGCLEDLHQIEQKVHASGAMLIAITEPISLGLLTSPGKFNADIVVGDAQPCGNYLSFGGPSAGYMATRMSFVRQLPGRLVGSTIDNRGQRAFTLTLQTREQHIRRSKATSNICTNQSLNALAMLVYLAMLGPQGLAQVAEISVRRAHYLAEELCKIPGIKLLYNQPYFNEFAIKLPLPASSILKKLEEQGILGGINLGNFYPELNDAILLAVTEMNSKEELDCLVSELSKILSSSNSSSSDFSLGRKSFSNSQPGKK